MEKRCDDVDCCGECRSPAGDVRDLVMQRQPTPIRDPIGRATFFAVNKPLENQLLFQEMH